MAGERIVILGAAGRDFHDFNVVYRDDPSAIVVAFTARPDPRHRGSPLLFSAFFGFFTIVVILQRVFGIKIG